MDLLAELGFTDYRFSLEWARIEPAPGHFSKAEIAHYRRMVEGATERACAPWSRDHFTVPRWFAERDDWIGVQSYARTRIATDGPIPARDDSSRTASGGGPPLPTSMFTRTGGIPSLAGVAVGPGPFGEGGARAGGLIGLRVLIAAEPADWVAGMTELGPVAWPPAPIRTERLVLREPEARDRAAFIELLASPKVHTYLGGSRPREELEREMPEVPERWPGSFVVDLDGEMIGQILLRRAPEHSRPAAAGKVDLGYMFLPRAWGFGYAAEACAAVLDWFDGVLPGEPVVLHTQAANVGSMRLAAKLGFAEVERFQAWDAEQWLGLRSPVTPSD